MKQVATLLLMCDRHDVGPVDQRRRRGRARPAAPRRAAGPLRHAAHLHLRRVSRRHRLQRAAVRHARRAACAHARADRRLPVRERLPELCRPGGADRTARQDRRAALLAALGARPPWPRRPRRPPTCHSSRAEAVSRIAATSVGGAAPAGTAPPRRLWRPAGSSADRAASRRDARLGGTVRDAAEATASSSIATMRPDDRHGRPRVGDIVRHPAEALEARASPARRRAGAGAGTRRRRAALRPAPPDRDGLCFLDLETTGLAGGAGTQAFLVGCAVIDGDGSGPAVPAARLRARAGAAADGRGVARRCTALVTFNGRTFDVPLIETRSASPAAVRRAPLPHLDMLHPARRLWRERPAVAGLDRRRAASCGARAPPCGRPPRRRRARLRDSRRATSTSSATATRIRSKPCSSTTGSISCRSRWCGARARQLIDPRAGRRRSPARVPGPGPSVRSGGARRCGGVLRAGGASSRGRPGGWEPRAEALRRLASAVAAPDAAGRRGRRWRELVGPGSPAGSAARRARRWPSTTSIARGTSWRRARSCSRCSPRSRRHAPRRRGAPPPVTPRAKAQP